MRRALTLPWPGYIWLEYDSKWSEIVRKNVSSEDHGNGICIDLPSNGTRICQKTFKNVVHVYHHDWWAGWTAQFVGTWNPKRPDWSLYMPAVYFNTLKTDLKVSLKLDVPAGHSIFRILKDCLKQDGKTIFKNIWKVTVRMTWGGNLLVASAW